MNFSQNKKDFFKNLLSLSFNQIIIYLLPLFLIPYLIRTIGTSNFGIISFIGAYTTYFQIVIDYGFNLTGTREVSLHRNENRELSKIFYSILFTKCVLAALITPAFLLLSFYIPPLHQYFNLIVWSYIGILCSVFNPVWFFQGLEKMEVITGANVLSKLIYLFLILFTVHHPEDFCNVFYIGVVSLAVQGVVSTAYAITRWRLGLFVPDFQAIKSQIQKGFTIFFSQAAGSAVSNTNIFALGMFFGTNQVGLYSIAEKSIKAASSIAVPFCTTLFPKISFLFKQDTKQALKRLKQALFYGGFFFAGISIAIFIFSDVIVFLIAGKKDQSVSNLIRIMAILPMSIFIDNIFGVQTLLNIGKSREFSRAVGYSAICSLLFIAFIVPPFGMYGSAVAYLLSELILMGLMVYFVRKSGIRLF